MRGEPFTGTSFKADMVSQPAERQARAQAREKLWQAVRKIVLIRDRRQCRVCGSREQIDVHHVRLRSAGGQDTSRNLACLCRICHGDVHLHKLVLSGNADQTLRIRR